MCILELTEPNCNKVQPWMYLRGFQIVNPAQEVALCSNMSFVILVQLFWTGPEKAF